jgi:hypothetical protein
MSASKAAPLICHGWTVFAHPLFLAQLEALAQQVEALKQKDPAGYLKRNAARRMAAVTKLAFTSSRKTRRGRNTGKAAPSAMTISTGSALSSFSSTDCFSAITRRAR